jgi:hypothetical protein
MVQPNVNTMGDARVSSVVFTLLVTIAHPGISCGRNVNGKALGLMIKNERAAAD